MTRSFDPFDELATMFLSAPAAGMPGAAIRRPPALRVAQGRVEMLIVGHLPVRAGLWLTPFADAMARDAGSTALVRLDSDEPTVQILRGPPHLADQSLGSDLRSVIDRLGGDIDTWIIRAEGSTPPASIIACQADRITILSSADEAAIVAAYQIIKNLAQASQDSSETPCKLPTVALAIVGAEPRDALAVVDRLNRTTVSFLGVEVKLALCLPRIDAGIKSTRALTFAHQPCPALQDAVEWIEAARRQPPRPTKPRDIAGSLHLDRSDSQISDAEHILRMAPAPATPPRQPLRVAPPPMPATTNGPTHAAPVPAPEPVESLESLVMGASVGAGNTPAPVSLRVKLSPKPAMRVEPKLPAWPTEPDVRGEPISLSAHVPGLTPLAARSPGHERVELAVDSSGRLHLLGHESSLRDLRFVENWALAHRELLAMAFPAISIDAAKRPACHVFTNEPAALSDLHGTDLHLHVLAPVVVNGQTGWFAAPLNTVR